MSKKNYLCRCCSEPRADHDERCSERRLFLGLMALASIAPLAACGSKEGEGKRGAIQPAEITQGTSCELDGMLLVDYPGPKGQIHFADSKEPAFFCDTMELLNTLIIPEVVRKVDAAFVQDMGQTDWDNPKGAWIDARTAIFVHGSKRKGSMGPTFASFSKEEDAKKFVQEYGGTIVRMADIKPEMVDLRGGANTDDRM